MPDRSRSEYLAELEEVLPFPAERRAEIVEEIATHLDDAVAGGASEAAAQSRLGDPVHLAEELARPEQSAVRLLAAAGAGVRAAIGPWLYGYLLATLIVIVAVFLVAALVTLAARAIGSSATFNTAGGWNTALTAIPMATALYFAGRSATRAASVTSRRLARRVRPWVATVGTVGAAAVLWFVMEAPQNVASVIALAMAPLAVVLGVYRPAILPARPRVPLLVIVGLLALIPLGILTSALLPPIEGFGEEIPGDTWEQRTAIVGPTWAAGSEPIFESNGWATTDDGVTAEWNPARPALLNAFSAIRLEAWRALDGSEWRLDPAYSAPFAIGPVTRDGDRLVGTVATHREPFATDWELVLTGVAADGVRYVLDAPGGGSGGFVGSASDWVAAVLD
jgi:uncharacterized membrane protein